MMLRLYDFKCVCGYIWEELIHPIDGKVVADCPKCGEIAHRIPSTYNFKIRSGPRKDSGQNKWY